MLERLCAAEPSPREVRAEYRTLSVSGSGTLRNVSETGIFVACDVAPREGEAVEVSIDYDPHSIVLRGRVCWVGRRADGLSGFGVELEFRPGAFLELLQRADVGCDDDALPSTVRRVAKRVSLSVPVAIEYGSLLDSGVLGDVSFTGARLEGMRLELAVGAEVTLTVAFEEFGTGCDVLAVVVRRTAAGGVAVQFRSVSEELKRRLRAVMEKVERIPSTEVG